MESCWVATKAPDALWSSPTECNSCVAVAFCINRLYASVHAAHRGLLSKFETLRNGAHTIFACQMQTTDTNVFTEVIETVWLVILEFGRYSARQLFCQTFTFISRVPERWDHIIFMSFVFIFFCFSKINHRAIGCVERKMEKRVHAYVHESERIWYSSIHTYR